MNIAPSRIGFGSTQQTQTTQEKEKPSPSMGRMALRYGIATPLTVLTVDSGRAALRGEGLMNNLLSKKIYAGIAAVGAVVGLGMKALADKYPDNKIIKTTNTIAKYAGGGFI